MICLFPFTIILFYSNIYAVCVCVWRTEPLVKYALLSSGLSPCPLFPPFRSLWVELPSSLLRRIINPGGIPGDLCGCPYQLLFSFCSSFISLLPFPQTPIHLCVSQTGAYYSQPVKGTTQWLAKDEAGLAADARQEIKDIEGLSKRRRERQREDVGSRDLRQSWERRNNFQDVKSKEKHKFYLRASWASEGLLELLTNICPTHTLLHTGLLLNTYYAPVRRVSHAGQGEIPVERAGAEKWGTVS